jgi:hypothetical protein
VCWMTTIHLLRLLYIEMVKGNEEQNLYRPCSSFTTVNYTSADFDNGKDAHCDACMITGFYYAPGCKYCFNQSGSGTETRYNFYCYMNTEFHIDESLCTNTCPQTSFTPRPTVPPADVFCNGTLQEFCVSASRPCKWCPHDSASFGETGVCKNALSQICYIVNYRENSTTVDPNNNALYFQAHPSVFGCGSRTSERSALTLFFLLLMLFTIASSLSEPDGIVGAAAPRKPKE